MKEYHEEMKKDAKTIFESDLRCKDVYSFLEKWRISGEISEADKDRIKRNK